MLCSLAEGRAHHNRKDTVLPLPQLVCESHTAGTAVAERVGLRERKLERAARGLSQFVVRHKSGATPKAALVEAGAPGSAFLQQKKIGVDPVDGSSRRNPSVG